MEDVVVLGHGSGGAMMHRLIDEVFLGAFGGEALRQGNDSAVVEGPAPGQRLAISTDTFVVAPRFFPGGNIGRLAVCGTVNDVATSGADVRYLSCGFVLEEGLPIDELHRVCASMAATAAEAGVQIVTGDTKVVARGQADGLYLNTTGVGYVPEGRTLGGQLCRPGDAVLVSGTLGDHGIAIMACREGLGFAAEVESDAAPLNRLVAQVLEAAPDARCFRDPTRGGLASALNEIAVQSQVDMAIDEAAVPVRDVVRGACDMLGFDVLQVANEGKMVCVVPAEQAEAALAAMQESPYGAEAAVIGQVGAAPEGRAPRVEVRTPYGSARVLDVPAGELLPRIC